MRHLPFVVFLALSAGCVRIGDLGGGYGRDLTRDGTVGIVGTHPVHAWGLEVGRIPVVIYAPTDVHGPLPAVIFLPGRVAPETQYESYGRALASHGILVAMRGWYSPLRTDPELAEDARVLADWLVERKLADPTRLGAAGHSMGAKDAIMAALDDHRFRAVVALDPDDNGHRTVAFGPIAKLQASLLLIGAEVSWKAARICAAKERNYEHFFLHAPPGTQELVLLGADHVQVMDRPDSLGMGICRCGTADSKTVRKLSRLATVDFFATHLAGEAPIVLPLGDAATLVTK